MPDNRTWKKQFLKREQFQAVLEYAVFQRLQLFGTFGHHYHIGTVNGTLRFTQPAQGQKPVVEHRVIELCKHNRNRRLHIAVLERVIKHYKVDFRVKPEHLLYACTAVLAHCHRYVASEFLINLIRLVAYIEWRRPPGGKHKTLGFSLISAA